MCVGVWVQCPEIATAQGLSEAGPTTSAIKRRGEGLSGVNSA